VQADLGVRYGLLHRIPRPVTPATMVFTADGYFGPDATRLGEGGNDTGRFVPGDVGRAETMVP